MAGRFRGIAPRIRAAHLRILGSLLDHHGRRSMNLDELIDREVAAALVASGYGSVVYPLEPAGVAAFRANRPTVVPPVDPATTITMRDVAVGGPDGGPDVIVRVYSPPARGEARPCCYWIHGGGYIFGVINMSDLRCVQTAETLDCVVISV